MSVKEQLKRFNPLRVVRTVDTVPRLQDLGDRLREDQKAMARQLRTITRQLEDIQQTLNRQQKVLDSVPELRHQVQQCITVYTRDARYADQLPALRVKLANGERLVSHVVSAVASTPLELEPFPHVVVDDLLPAEMCDELIAALPSSLFFTQNMKRQEIEVPFKFAPEYSRLVWNTFFQKVITEAMLPALTEKFRPVLDDFLRLHWPELGSMAQAGITLRVVNSRVLLRRPGYVIKPHRDPRWAFLTCLIYLPKAGELQSYGTQLYRLRNEPEITHSSPLWVDAADCELVKDVPARANTALVFFNSVGAHGASIPPDAPADIERNVYQVQFGVDQQMKQRLIDGLSGKARESWEMVRGGAY